MKKLFKNFLMLTAVGAIAFLYSCSEEDEPTAAAPSVSVSAALADGTAVAGGSDVVVGTTFTVTLTGTTPGGFDSFILSANGTEVDRVTRTDLQLEAGQTSATASVNVTVGDEEVGQTIDWTFTVVDDLSQTGEATFSYNVVAPPSPDAKVLTAKMLAAPTGDNESATFYSIRNDVLYSQADVLGTSDPVSEAIDLAYYYGASDEATLVSPDEYPDNIVDLSAWGTTNTTNLVLTTISSEDYMAISTVADVAAAIENVTFGDDNTITNLSVGDILAFQTTDASEISGLIMVQEINGTFNAGDNIVIELITSQEAE